MHVGRNLRVRAARFNFNATVAVVFVRDHAEGRVVQSFDPPGEIELGDGALPQSAELEMTPEQAMELMSELWDLGLRPKGKFVEPDQFERERQALLKQVEMSERHREDLFQATHAHLSTVAVLLKEERERAKKLEDL